MPDGTRFSLETNAFLSRLLCPARWSDPTGGHSVSEPTAVLAAILLVAGGFPLAALVASGNTLDGLGQMLKAGAETVATLTIATSWLPTPAALRQHGRRALGRRHRSFSSAMLRRRRVNAELDEIEAEFEARLSERTHDLELKADTLEKTNASLSQYAHCAAHDLQEPLRKIVAFAEIAREQDKSGDPELALYLDKINEAARRARTLVRDILRHAELDQHRLELRELSLKTEIGNAIESLELPIGERQGRIESEIEDITVLADPTLVAQVIQNLVANALKYTPTERLPHINLSLSRSGDGASLAIADNGMGFDPAFSDRIFEPFTRLHAGVGVSGTGMGLAIVTKALALLGWSISVHTEESKGTRFVIDIPAPHLVAATASPLQDTSKR